MPAASARPAAAPAELATLAVPEWPSARLHIVTGKGGTGKTTVAAALAIALARGSRRTLLVEVEGRQGIAQLFDCGPLPYQERRVAVAPEGGEVRALAVDVEAALIEYLEMFYGLRRAGRALRKMGAVDFATAIAPGMGDVLLTGKVKEATTRTASGKRVYDAVVLDAPPTGRISKFLNVTAEVSGLAKVGPIKTQSDGVMAVLRSSQTAVHLVTLLEEMPVQETVDAIDDLERTGLPIGTIIVNAAQESLLPPAELPRALAGRLGVAKISSGLSTAGLNGQALGKRLAAEASAHAQRYAVQNEALEQVLALQRPTYQLPLLPGPMDLGGVFELAEVLHEAGVQ